MQHDISRTEIGLPETGRSTANVPSRPPPSPPGAPVVTPSPVPAGPAGNDTAASRFLRRLNEYKEFIAIIIAAGAGSWAAISYFVTQERFATEMIHNQCLLIANISKLSYQINTNYASYIEDKTFDQLYRYQQKSVKSPLTTQEEKDKETLAKLVQSSKKDAEELESKMKTFDEALTTGNCSKLITYEK